MKSPLSPALERLGAALLVTRVVRLEQRGLLTGAATTVLNARALPIDWTRRRPVMDAFLRNLEAAL